MARQERIQPGSEHLDAPPPEPGPVAPAAGARKAELDAAVTRAAAAQPAWGATNPQRRARVMMEFARLLNRDMDKLAEAGSLISAVADSTQKAELTAIYEDRAAALEGEEA